MFIHEEPASPLFYNAVENARKHVCHMHRGLHAWDGTLDSCGCLIQPNSGRLANGSIVVTAKYEVGIISRNRLSTVLVFLILYLLLSCVFDIRRAITHVWSQCLNVWPAWAAPLQSH